MKVFKYLLLFYILTIVNFSKLNAQSLDSLLQLVVENNTQLKAIELEYQSILAKQSQVSQLPNPQFGVGIPVLRPETRLGPQMVMVSATQFFPWFGTLKSKEAVVVSMSKVKYEQLAIVKLDLFYEVQSAYFQLYFLNQKLAILAKNIQIFESLETVSLAKIEVLRIQTRLQGLRQQILMIENDKSIFESTINEITKQPIGSKIIVSDNLILPAMEFNIESFRSKLESNHPLITQINYQIEQSSKTLVVNSNMNKPAVGIGLDYSLVGQRTDANPQYNGRDILVPRVMVSIPIYRKAYKGKIEEERLIQESLGYKKENVLDKMLRLLVSYKANFDNGQLESELYQNQTNTIQMAYDVLLAEYSSSGKGFEELLMVQNQLLDFELGVSQAELKRNLAQSNIERITNF